MITQLDLFTQLTGTIYYFTNASNRQHFQNYFCHTISNVFSELGHVNIFILMICIISFTRLNYNIINLFSNLWSRPIINVIFLCLRFISAIKVVIAVLRGLIKARKITRFESKAALIADLKYVEKTVQLFDNKCIICLDELYPNSKEKTLLLDCGHIFHFDCFKLWYVESENCPYCRKKVDL